MLLRAERLAAHLAGGARALQPLYVVHGGEPLLAQEAADAIRAAARAAGFAERAVHAVSGAHFDWSGLVGDVGERSLFADRRLVEVRIPSGRPGKDGGEALQRLAAAVAASDGTVMAIVELPGLDRTQLKSAWFAALEHAGAAVAVEPVERAALPGWLARRLAAQGQHVADGDAGAQTLAWLADRLEGNLLAAQQELHKLALLHPPGALVLEQVEAAVADVARFDPAQLGAAVLGGQAARAWRILQGLRDEGEAAARVHWLLAEDLRALAGVKRAVDAGRPLPVAFNEQRVWGPRQRTIERALARAPDAAALAALVDAASVCDGVVKGLRRPDWPVEPWDALRRLVALALAAFASPSRTPSRGERRVVT